MLDLAQGAGFNISIELNKGPNHKEVKDTSVTKRKSIYLRKTTETGRI